MPTFDIEWARRVFSESIKRVEARLKARKDGVTKRVLREWALEAERPEAQRLAQRLGMTVGNLHVRATRVRHALRDEMLAQVEAYTGDGVNAREEVDEILRILMERPRPLEPGGASGDGRGGERRGPRGGPPGKGSPGRED